MLSKNWDKGNTIQTIKEVIFKSRHQQEYYGYPAERQGIYYILSFQIAESRTNLKIIMLIIFARDENR